MAASSSSKLEVYIVGAARTPIGSLNGALSTVPAHQLGSTAITAALERASISVDKVCNCSSSR